MKRHREPTQAEEHQSQSVSIRSAELLNIQGHAGWVHSASFSPDGRKIVSAGNGGNVRVWDSSTGQQLLVLQGHAGWVHSASFSPDGRKIVSSGDGGAVRVWLISSDPNALAIAQAAGEGDDVARLALEDYLQDHPE